MMLLLFCCSSASATSAALLLLWLLHRDVVLERDLAFDIVDEVQTLRPQSGALAVLPLDKDLEVRHLNG